MQLSAATQPLAFFLTASSDHVTGLTGKAGSVTVKLRKSGGAAVTPSGAIAEVDATNFPGWYEVAGHATDSNTLGPMLLHAKDAASDPYDDLFPVVAYNPLAATNLGLSALPAANPAASGGLPTVDASNAVKVQSGTGANQISLTGGLVTLAAVTHTGAVIPTVTMVATTTTLTDKAGFSLTQAFPTNFADLAIAATTGRVTAGTVSDKTGYALSGTQAFDLTGNVTGNITGNLSGSVGSVTATVPLGTHAPAAWLNAAAIDADAVAAGVDLNAGAITAAAFATDAISAAAVSAAAVTKVQAGLPTAAGNLAAWKADADVITLLAVGNSLDLMIVTDGAGAYEYTAGALANAPAGGGSAPTAGANAAAVRTELTTELARLDVAVSTRGTSTYAGADTSGTTTLLARIPGTVAAQTGDAFARLGAPAGASLAADVAAVKADTAASRTKTDLIPDLAATGTVTGSGGTTTTLVGDSGLSASDDFYVGAVLAFTSGALKGTGGRRIGDYVGSTRTFSFAEPWPAAPADGTTFVILGRIDPAS